MLELNNFRKSYDSRCILHIPELQIGPGLHWFRGRNGSGKSTLFRCIAGVSPFEGDIILNGKFNPNKTEVDYRFRVNYTEAEPKFPAFLSGREVMDFVAKTKATDGDQIQKLVQKLHLNLYYENPSSTYSSGMAKKIALALAFLGKPELIILDEPFNALDSESCENLQQLISEASDSGTSFFISSHPESGMERLAFNSILEVSDGNVRLT